MSILSQKYKDYQFIQGTSEQGTSDDLISRQAVLDLLEDTNNGWIINEVSQLPSVNPQEPKTGHWIEVLDEEGFIDGNPMKLYHYECSECSCEDANLGKNNYCPNCGARMTEGSDTE